MDYELPDHETLVELSEKDPEAIEKIRREATEALINRAPEVYQRRLRGLQFQIDMEVRRSKSPMESCLRVSKMMHDSMGKLRHSLNQVTGETDICPSPIEESEPEERRTADILEFES